METFRRYAIVAYLLGIFSCLSHALSRVTQCGPDLICEQVTEYCCESPGYFCCDYATFFNGTHGDDVGNVTEDNFIRMGLKSALVLLILSSAIFLLCFCIMRCCQRAGLRSSNPRQGGSIADYRRGHSRADSLSTRLSNRTFHFLSLGLPHSSTDANDEPPSYSEVMQPGSTPEPEVQVVIETEKPPPDYSSVIKEDHVIEGP